MSKKAVFWVSGLVVLGVITFLWVGRTPQRPQLQVSESVFNMGTVPLGRTGHYRVKLINNGNAPLLIQGIKPG